MEADLLQQLRDIHLPAEPLWWPPAPGWWLLAMVVLAAVVYALHRLRLAIARRRPIREARRQYDLLYGAFRRGEIDAISYLHQANELLKRLYIHALHVDVARRANDADWLAFLDARSGSDRFSDGPGSQLGNQRFRPEPQADPETLHPLVLRLLEGARP
ncbi:MAG: DUF4381 domain-containing protein [Pseudomonadales bacterium]